MLSILGTEFLNFRPCFIPNKEAYASTLDVNIKVSDVRKFVSAKIHILGTLVSKGVKKGQKVQKKR